MRVIGFVFVLALSLGASVAVLSPPFTSSTARETLGYVGSHLEICGRTSCRPGSTAP
jgi:hypothetical protein